MSTRNPVRRQQAGAPQPTSRERFDDVRFRLEASTSRTSKIAAVALISSSGPDPILRVIEEGRRLLAVCRAEYEIPDPGLEPRRARVVAQRATWTHWRGPLRKVVPATAHGCAELARYVAEFASFQGQVDEEDLLPLFALIARSPLL